MKVLDQVILNFSQEGLFALNIVIALIMFGVALDIRWGHFLDLLKNPKSLVAGVVAQFLLLPSLTFLLVLAIRPTPTVALGMILVASCPGGNVSNFMSYLAKGILLFVDLQRFHIFGLVIMTFNFCGVSCISTYLERNDASAYLVPIELDLMDVAFTVFLLLGLPVLLGMLCRNYFPRLTAKITKPIRTGSIIIFISYIVILLGANFDPFKKYIHHIFLIVLLHNGLALMAGYLLARFMKLPVTDRRSVTIETGIQNSGLALVLIFNPRIFPPELQLGGMAFIAAWWGVWHIVSGLTLASLWSRKAPHLNR